MRCAIGAAPECGPAADRAVCSWTPWQPWAPAKRKNPNPFSTVRRGKAHCRVGGRRTCLRIRWLVRRFRSGPQSGFHHRVSSRRPPNRTCGFPASGSPGGSCTSHSERSPSGTATSTQSAAHAPQPTYLPNRALTGLFTPGHPRKPIPPHGPSIFESFTYACGVAGLTDLYPGLRTCHCPEPFVLWAPLRTCGPFPLRALPRVFSTTNRSATLTTRPAPHGVPVAACHSSDRASRVANIFPFLACQRQYPGESMSVRMSLTSRHHDGLPLINGGSALALPVSRPGVAWLCSRLETICYLGLHQSARSVMEKRARQLRRLINLVCAMSTR